ncbi:MurNAc alpha-1-phosphate uridylyltransferase [Dongia mobilis]|uniref:MurNAc alpha-1-phosphate uridylyltransferase n=1 Tax=Dongia mobilis TaxID=578943 RepID=A0A4R6WVS7_9PROT|nr:nucleotidyltransferase family protein [Dongia mobilis]TDQ83436.1 MurNAc alpha-1-phosphate uridylyltransferase [Dongia mobilis]
MSKPSFTVPHTAMVMAAGLATRLRPITDSLPKALVPVLGVPMLDVVLNRLRDAGVKRVVINLHHLGEQIRAHLKDRADLEILYSEETEILETGGGIVQALPLLGDDPFFTVNAKIIWLNGKTDALHRLAAAWDDARMDALLLLQPTVTAVGYDGIGDFTLDQEGRVRRRREWQVAPFLYAGIQICHPRLFRDAPQGKFSTNLLWDRAIEQDRLYGLRHDGEWYHVSTPQHLAEVERHLSFHGIRF